MVKEEEAEEKDEPVFTPAEFDETEFLQTENRSARMIYISLSVALIAGILSFFIMRALHWMGSDLYNVLPIAAPIILLMLVYFLMKRFGIELRDLDWKKYLENGFMYTVTWGAIWMVSMNPPFSDLSSPIVSDPIFKVTVGSRTSLHFEENDTFGNVESISTFFVVTDNVGTDDVDFTIRLKEGSQEMDIAPGSDLAKGVGLKIERVDDNTTLSPDKNETKTIREIDGWYGSDIGDWSRNLYMVSLGNLTGYDDEFTVFIRAEATDRSGNTQTKEISFKVDNGR